MIIFFSRWRKSTWFLMWNIVFLGTILELSIRLQENFENFLLGIQRIIFYLKLLKFFIGGMFVNILENFLKLFLVQKGTWNLQSVQETFLGIFLDHSSAFWGNFSLSKKFPLWRYLFQQFWKTSWKFAHGPRDIEILGSKYFSFSITSKSLFYEKPNTE